MTRYKPGDVVLVRFPFSDLRSAKKRPAVIISPSDYALRYGDVAVLGLTSQPQAEEFLALRYWHTSGLLGPTWIKAALFTVAESIIDKQLGVLHAEDDARIPKALSLLIAGIYHS
jgi:mRNA interferase MazF